MKVKRTRKSEGQEDGLGKGGERAGRATGSRDERHSDRLGVNDERLDGTCGQDK